jgi:hypothetical protein
VDFAIEGPRRFQRHSLDPERDDFSLDCETWAYVAACPLCGQRATAETRVSGCALRGMAEDAGLATEIHTATVESARRTLALMFAAPHGCKTEHA